MQFVRIVKRRKQGSTYVDPAFSQCVCEQCHRPSLVLLHQQHCQDARICYCNLLFSNLTNCVFGLITFWQMCVHILLFDRQGIITLYKVRLEINVDSAMRTHNL